MEHKQLADNYWQYRTCNSYKCRNRLCNLYVADRLRYYRKYLCKSRAACHNGRDGNVHQFWNNAIRCFAWRGMEYHQRECGERRECKRYSDRCKLGSGYSELYVGRVFRCYHRECHFIAAEHIRHSAPVRGHYRYPNRCGWRNMDKQ